MTPQQIDLPTWLSWKLTAERLTKYREPLLQSENYLSEFDTLAGGMYMITTDLPKYKDQPKVNGLMVSTQQRLWDAMNWLSLQYSAGSDIGQIATVWLHALTWAEEYAGFSHRFNQSPDAYGRVVAHVALRTEDYWIVAIRLVCFGLLTGHAKEMPRVMAILDYANEAKDGLIERLVAPFVPGRPAPPDTCTRHLPYRKLLKVFTAEDAKRPALLARYLDEWYEASRREPYIDQDDSKFFYGYWSWEAAAVTWLLNIDDCSYRNKSFYPRDLVDFARTYAAAPNAATPDATPVQEPRLRVEAGQPCPQTGYWFTPAHTNSRRHFTEGVFMPATHSDYGSTIWQWDNDQN